MAMNLFIGISQDICWVSGQEEWYHIYSYLEPLQNHGRDPEDINSKKPTDLLRPHPEPTHFWIIMMGQLRHNGNKTQCWDEVYCVPFIPLSWYIKEGYSHNLNQMILWFRKTPPIEFPDKEVWKGSNKTARGMRSINWWIKDGRSHRCRYTEILYNSGWM